MHKAILKSKKLTLLYLFFRVEFMEFEDSNNAIIEDEQITISN